MRLVVVGIVLAVFVATLAVVGGCGGDALREAGTSCGSDDECAAGLSCVGLGNASGSTCTTVARACTKTCDTDLDCLAVGSGFRCLPNCQNGGTCVQTRLAGD